MNNASIHERLTMGQHDSRDVNSTWWKMQLEIELSVGESIIKAPETGEPKNEEMSNENGEILIG